MKGWLLVGLPASLDLNLIESLLSIIKQDLYSGGCQFESKDVLRVTTTTAAAEAVQTATIKKLTGFLQLSVEMALMRLNNSFCQ